MTPVAQETSKKTEISTLLNTFERKMKNIGEKQVALKPKEKAVLLLLASGMNIWELVGCGYGSKWGTQITQTSDLRRRKEWPNMTYNSFVVPWFVALIYMSIAFYCAEF